MSVTMTTTKSAREMGQSLFEFDRAVDAHAGAPQMFAATVLALRECRAEASQVDARKAQAFDLLKAHYERGERTLASDGRRLKATKPGATQYVRTVPSAKIKRCSPTLWEQAKVPVPYVQAKAPASYGAEAVVPLPGIPNGCDVTASAVLYERLLSRSKEVKATEAELVDRLKKIGANNGWDGMPIEFTDGWRVSLARMQYSAERLAEIAPETFAQLSEVVERTRASTVYIAKKGAPNDDADDDAEDVSEHGYGL